MAIKNWIEEWFSMPSTPSSSSSRNKNQNTPAPTTTATAPKTDADAIKLLTNNTSIGGQSKDSQTFDALKNGTYNVSNYTDNKGLQYLNVVPSTNITPKADTPKADEPKAEQPVSYQPASYSAPQQQYDALGYLEAIYNKLNETQYNSPYTEAQQAVLDKLLNRDPFSYNYLEDPAYQAYAKQYAFYGDQARQDTLGDVAGMTGGMPSSYAVSAAQQAQNQWNSRLTDIIPELQNAAYQRYQGDFQNNVDVSNILNTLDSTAYSRYDNDRNFAWNGATTIGGMQYQVNRDNVLDAQWLAQFNADEAQRAVSNAISNKQISIQEGELALKQAEAQRNSNGYYTTVLAEAIASGNPTKWLQDNASSMTPELYEYIKSQIGGSTGSAI